MDTALSEQLKTVAIETLENFCKLFPVAESPGEGKAEDSVGVGVEFVGPACGYLSFRASGGLSSQAAQRFMESDRPCEPPQQLDALMELANIICGNILPYVSGPRAIFRMMAPKVLSEGPPGPPLQVLASVKLPYEAGAAELQIWVQESKSQKIEEVDKTPPLS